MRGRLLVILAVVVIADTMVVLILMMVVPVVIPLEEVLTLHRDSQHLSVVLPAAVLVLV